MANAKLMPNLFLLPGTDYCKQKPNIYTKRFPTGTLPGRQYTLPYNMEWVHSKEIVTYQQKYPIDPLHFYR